MTARCADTLDVNDTGPGPLDPRRAPSAPSARRRRLPGQQVADQPRPGARRARRRPQRRTPRRCAPATPC